MSPQLLELERVWDQSSRATRRRGRRWYGTAREILRELAEEYGYGLEQAVAVLAITSPGCHLKTNLDWTRQTLSTDGAAKVGRFPNAMAPKIRGVLASREAAHEFVTGPKVGPFHRAILGDTDALVIDRWAAAATNPERRIDFTAEERRAIDSAYRALAKTKRMNVRDMQAIIWIQVRETTPDARGRIRKLADITD